MCCSRVDPPRSTVQFMPITCPMNAEELYQRIDDIRASVAAVRLQLFQSPANLVDDAGDRLSSAVASFEVIQTSLDTLRFTPDARAELCGRIQTLANEIFAAASVAKAGSAHTKDWLDWLCMRFQGYGSDGEPNRLPRAGRVQIQG